MPHHGMTPHISGRRCPRKPATRPAPGKILEVVLHWQADRDEYLIVDGGKLAGTGAFLQHPRRELRS